MPVPGYDEFMLPLLQLAGNQQEYSMAEARDKMVEAFNLSNEDLRELLPSGKQAVFPNRVAWAKTYLLKAGLLESRTRGKFNITKRGMEVLEEKPATIDRKYLMKFSEFREFVGPSDNSTVTVDPVIKKTGTPEEVLEAAVEELNNTLIQEVLKKVLDSPPSFFEQLVVDLLLAMGYGGSRKDAGHAIGKSGDEGIDGIIKEDKLGLDIIYIQAKRWANPIGRPDIQKFVGALAGQRAKKGVFLTTSDFTKEAQFYVKGIESKVVLINGQELAKLMIQHNLGVSVNEVYEVKRLDTDYFEG